MGSLFTDVYGYALQNIVDYKLDKLAESDYESFLLYLEGILINVIPEFDGCIKSLNYKEIEIEDDETGELSKVNCFDENLDNKEKSILGKLMVINWFTGKIQDVTQFQGSLSTRDFKRFSESNNLKQKSLYLNNLKEAFEQEVTDYQLSHLDKLPFFGDFN